MFLGLLTFVLLCLVLVLKYRTATRIVHLNHRLWEAENRCKKHTESLKIFQSKRKIAERQESILVRKQLSLEGELSRVEQELETLKEANMEVIQELVEKKVNIHNIKILEEPN